MRKLLALITIINFLGSGIPACGYAQSTGYSQVPAYLCELGIDFYNQGDFQQALHEFNKALLAQPGYPLALEYIEKITSEEAPRMQEGALSSVEPTSKKRSQTIKEFLDNIEGKKAPVAAAAAPQVPTSAKATLPPQVLQLTEDVRSLAKPIEIEQGKDLIISGSNITRFLLTSPDILKVEKKDPNELLLTGKDFGFTYLHIWDDQGRWTLQFITVPAKPEGPTLEDIMRKEAEHAGTFKLRYSLDYDVFEKGRSAESLSRQSYNFTHILGLDGATPYGDFSSQVGVNVSQVSTDLSYIALGLTEGRLGPFKDFTLRAMDYELPFTNLTLTSTYLRGVMLESPAFNKKIDYTVFWGRESGGRFGNLSPGLSKFQDSFLSGMDFAYRPTFKQSYGFSVIHGWGRDRPPNLNAYNYDVHGENKLSDQFRLNYETAYDSQKFASLLTATYSMPKFRLVAEARDTDKEFNTAIGNAYREGQIGTLFNLFANPTNKLNITSRLDVYRDTLFPNPKNSNMLNEDLDFNALYTIDPLTSLSLDYSLQNELGRLGPFRYYSPGVGLNRTIELLSKKIYAYANYRHQDNNDYTNPSVNYTNEKVVLGVRLPILGDLNYYATQEFNWLHEVLADNNTRPEAFETGVDWTNQIFKTPLYGDFRMTYRKERNTDSPLSFLSGEDYIEGYTQITYRPNPDTQLYTNARVRNVWAGGNQNVTKRVEGEFQSGLRYAWDTGLRWESVGTIDGYVFKDLNGNGLKERDDPPVEGVRVWLGKDKSVVTDLFGYFKFTKVKARNVYVSIDTSTIPSGFMLTVPVVQELSVSHGQTARAYFGIISRSEITGTVFEDRDNNGQLGPRDKGVAGVVLLLEDGRKIVTDDSGRYFIRNVSTGKHTLTLDLKTLSTQYIPSVPIFKEIELFEGVSYVYNIPVKKTE